MIRVPAEKPLALISRIVGRTSIEGADSIESVRVLGWNCVAKKEEFRVGDLCVYFVIGSIFPSDYERTLFLKDKPLKTKRMLGTLSQGLVAPLSWLEDFGRNPADFVEGDDVTSLFGIMKAVEAEEASQYRSKPRLDKHGNPIPVAAPQRPFPYFIPKTDEERVQNIPHILTDIQGQNVVITRKEDGCSATFYVNDSEFTIATRNFIADIDAKTNFHYVSVAKSYRLEEKMVALGRNLALQGEIIGPKISGNRLQLRQLEFRVFNVFDITTQEYLANDEVVTLCTELNIPTVPILYQGIAQEHPDGVLASVDSLVGYADTLSYTDNPIDVPAEGVVVKLNQRFSSGYPRVSFKAISNNYLLKYKL